jgi:hypothetical protein
MATYSINLSSLIRFLLLQRETMCFKKEELSDTSFGKCLHSRAFGNGVINIGGKRVIFLDSYLVLDVDIYCCVLL